MDPSGIEYIFDNATWTSLGEIPVDAESYDIPYATHEGWLEVVPGLRLHVYQINNGRRMIDEESMRVFVRWLAGE